MVQVHKAILIAAYNIILLYQQLLLYSMTSYTNKDNILLSFFFTRIKRHSKFSNPDICKCQPCLSHLHIRKVLNMSTAAAWTIYKLHSQKLQLGVNYYYYRFKKKILFQLPSFIWICLWVTTRQIKRILMGDIYFLDGEVTICSVGPSIAYNLNYLFGPQVQRVARLPQSPSFRSISTSSRT